MMGWIAFLVADALFIMSLVQFRKISELLTKSHKREEKSTQQFIEMSDCFDRLWNAHNEMRTAHAVEVSALRQIVAIYEGRGTDDRLSAPPHFTTEQ